MDSRKVRLAGALTVLLGSVFLNAQTTPAQRDIRPVTDAMLQTPDAGEWLNWRGAQNTWGYSALNQINKQNVGRLQLAWSWALNTGASQPAPLVHDGVMFIPNPGGGVQALDATNGDLLWEYRRRYERADRAVEPMRSIAIYGDKIFVNTADAHIVALNVKTGAVVWDHQVADNALGYEYTSGPIIAKGKVVAGMTGCTRYKEDVCFISAHDPNTGQEVWRTATVAKPGEPGGDSWGDLPLRFRAGGDAWIPGSYDPSTNLIYWSTAQAKPWARAVRGTDGDALYTNSTLALDPDTGRMNWYYQYLPGETHDMDEVFENILVDTGSKSSLYKMGKLGILWEIDRKTGKFISAHDIGYQTLLDVDRQTGKVTYRPGKIPEIGVEVNFCPSTAGFKSWRAMAFNPQTNALYVPMNLNCEIATFGPTAKVAGGGGTGPVRRKNTKHPQSDGNLGEFLALDVTSGKILWRHRTPSPSNTAALATAGGVVFGGDWDRHMYAYDAATGKVLWQTRLPTSAQGFPITYLANGRQYVAMPAGIGGGSWSTLIAPELAPEIRRPNSGNALLVFALPTGSR